MKRIEISVWNIAFWIVIICQATVLPATLGLGVISRLGNGLVLLLFAVGAAAALTRKHHERVTAWYLAPAFLVALGYLVNIFRGGATEALGHLALVVPWLAILSVPFVTGLDWTRYWRQFHLFMFGASLLALAEYAAVANELLTPTIIQTDLGIFNKGVFTIFHALEDGEFYPRLYGVFPEPGTHAMFLLPAIAYALVMRKFVALGVYLACMVFTASLGGYLGLGLMGIPLVIWFIRSGRTFASLTVILGSLAFVAIFGGLIYDYVTAAYAGRGASATIRESNVQLFVKNLLPAMATHPLGFPLRGEAYSQLEGQDFYFGSNFTVATAMVTGGVLSFVGYVGFIASSLAAWAWAFFGRRATGVEACVLLCLPALISFIVQRATIFESALFAYLFAPLILEILRGRWMAADTEFMRNLRAWSTRN